VSGVVGSIRVVPVYALKQVSSGGFVPTCEVCAYRGKVRSSRALAMSAVRAHCLSTSHKLKLAASGRGRT
jgi:hypothetical protein